MAYKESVYIKAKNTLEKRKADALSKQEARHSAVLLKCPEIEKIEREMSSYGAEVIRAVGSGADAGQYVQALSVKSLDAQRRRREILTNAGFPADYLEVKYTCPLCRDTGSHDGYYCDCYKKLIRQTAKEELHIAALLEQSTFEKFDLKYYPDITDGVLGISQKEHMTNVFEYCRDYARYFTRKSKGLIMLGKTGLGKTHLSLAIADAVIDKGFNVYYNSVQNVMNQLEKEHFGRRKTEEESIEEDLFESDLLILDDLGSEFSTQFTISQLYNILSTRITNSLPTVISTNLTLSEIEEKYSQRVASRIVGNSTPIQFVGKDIRQQKNI